MIDTEAGGERKRAHGGGGPVAGVAQNLGEGGLILAEHEEPVVAHAVSEWDFAGHQARMRRQSDRHRRHGILEEYPFRRQTIDHRRACDRVSVAADVIGAGGIESHHQDVPARRRRSTRAH